MLTSHACEREHTMESKIDDPVAHVLHCFQERGGSNYGKEAVTQVEHALQAAYAAEQAGGSPQLIAACLLHDIGHLLHDLPEDAPDHDIDDQHEQLAAAWLTEYFVPEVVEPVRLHVAAKRYLCYADPEYFSHLSPPSVQSLALQGGPMTAQQAAHFEKHPHFDAAIQLRRFDEAAKVPGLHTPSVEHYRDHLEKSLIGRRFRT
jgi:phosphonate degradation associated HDIG domain protein